MDWDLNEVTKVVITIFGSGGFGFALNYRFGSRREAEGEKLKLLEREALQAGGEAVELLADARMSVVDYVGWDEWVGTDLEGAARDSKASLDKLDDFIARRGWKLDATVVSAANDASGAFRERHQQGKSR